MCTRGNVLADCKCFLNDVLEFLRAAPAVQCDENNVPVSQPCSSPLTGDCATELDQQTLAKQESSFARETEDVQYYNTFDRLNDTRSTLVSQCYSLLARLEKELLHDGCNNDNSYMEMGKAGQTQTCYLVDAGATVDICDSAEPTDDAAVPQHDTVTPKENSYDLTTDTILYDECLKSGSNESMVQEPPESTTDCPFSGLPATHLRLQQSPKYGTLFKQGKRLFFEQSKKYYVGLLQKWLLVYTSHNDLKPCQCICVKDIKLDLSLNEQFNEKHLFQIITVDDVKIHFLSPSFKDLNEWIVAIQNNLLGRSDNSSTMNFGLSPRKLPLPPFPLTEENHKYGEPDDSIYEEPQLLDDTKRIREHAAGPDNYDVPRSLANDFVSSARVNEMPDMLTPPTTPVKNWFFNKFNKSPDASDAAKPCKKIAKKLSYNDVSTYDSPQVSQVTNAPNATALPIAGKSIGKLSLKGSKINMIINQLEANGQLNLLSKSLNDPNKRLTWCTDGLDNGKIV